jgi:hypothetical protein
VRIPVQAGIRRARFRKNDLKMVLFILMFSDAPRRSRGGGGEHRGRPVRAAAAGPARPS